MDTQALMDILSGKTKSNTYQLPNGGGPYSANSGMNSDTANSTPMIQRGQIENRNGMQFPVAPNVDINGNMGGVQGSGQAPQPQPEQKQYFSHEDLANGFNSAVFGTPTKTASNGMPAAMSPTQQYFALRGQQANDRANGTGLYFIDPSKAFSPDQIRQQYNDADQAYGSQLDAIAVDAQNEQKNKPMQSLLSGLNKSADGTDASAYVNALLSSPKIGASNVDTQRILTQLSGQSPDQQIQTIKQITYNNLDTTQKANYDSNQSASETAAYALSKVSPDLVNNPYKYNLNNYITYFGGKKDPKYTEFMQLVSSVVAPIRKSFFGASLTASEQKAAAQFLPDPATDDAKAIVTKMKNVSAIASYTNDVMIANTLGLPKPKLSDYIDKNESSDSSVGWF